MQTSMVVCGGGGGGGGLMAAGEKIYNEDLWEIKRGKQK